jgi:hypothetical protein
MLTGTLPEIIAAVTKELPDKRTKSTSSPCFLKNPARRITSMVMPAPGADLKAEMVEAFGLRFADLVDAQPLFAAAAPGIERQQRAAVREPAPHCACGRSSCRTHPGKTAPMRADPW